MYKKKKPFSNDQLNESRERYISNYLEYGLSLDFLESEFLYQGSPHQVLGLAASLRNSVVKNTNTGNFYILDNASVISGFSGDPATKPNQPVQSAPSPKEFQVETVKMKNIKYDPSIFIPMKIGGPIDYMFSTKGGIMPATNYLVYGDPGIGKSTTLLDIASNIQISDPTKKVLFISAEMTRIDMYEYIQRYPKFGEIETMFLGEYIENDPKRAIETLYQQGYDLIIVDTISEVCDLIKETYKMSTRGAEKWFVDQMVNQNTGNNDRSVHASFLAIQQVGKGGNFVGSNKLKHNTTGTMTIKYEKNGDRYISFEKNRRGCRYDRLYFSLGDPESEIPQEDVKYDIDRLKKDLEIKSTLEDEKDTLAKEEEFFQSLIETAKNPKNPEEENGDSETVFEQEEKLKATFL